MQSSSRICLFGASPTTGNQGVNALCWSVLDGMHRRDHEEITVFDYGRGRRSASFASADYTLQGITVGKRFWRSNHIGIARKLAAAGIRHGSLLRTVSDSGLVLDVSGGDSFTDLYGNDRFRQIIAPKEIALNLGRRLVLLPQTYGPFRHDANRREARRVIDGAAMAYARDEASFERLRTLLGDRFDPDRHRAGVDLAFCLPSKPPRVLEAELAGIIEPAASPLIGLNVSGLLANRPGDARRQFSLAANYPALMHRLLIQLLDETSARILLIPHVHAPSGHYESDLDAALALLASLPARYGREVRRRIAVVNQPLDACELKWLIGRCDWFCGTRMHSTIAALSSGVPTVALAYSLKTRGVFETCGLEDCVIDLRDTSVGDALGRLTTLYYEREEVRARLSSGLPRVRRIGNRQLDEIAGCALQRPVSPDSVKC